MNLKLQIIIVCLSIFFILYLSDMIGKDKLSLKYSLSWLIIATLVMLIGIFPKTIKYVSTMLGIYEPINALFFLGFIFVLSIIYSMTVSQSRMAEKMKKLAQYISIEGYENDRN